MRSVDLAVKSARTLLTMTLLIIGLGCGRDHMPVSGQGVGSVDPALIGKVDYTNDIGPLMKKKCLICHFPGAPQPDWTNYSIAAR